MSAGSPAYGPLGEDSAASAEMVQLNDVTVDYATGSRFSRAKKIVRAVDNVSLSIEHGATLGLVGGTGSGKTTIAQLVMGMLKPTSGDVFVNGRDPQSLTGKALQDHRRRVQVVMQDPYSSLDPRMRVGDIIAEPLMIGGSSRQTRETRGRVAELLELVGLPARKADLFPYQFSGGQRQRIAIARALAPQPEIVVLDEPTSALDVSVRAQILKLLRNLQQTLNITYLVISHDLISVAYLADAVAVMYQGRIVEYGPTRSIYKSSRHPYTLLLHESSPDAKGTFLKLPKSPVGVGADGVHQAEHGCRYRPRCSLYLELGEPSPCRESEPVLAGESVGNGYTKHAAACHFSTQVKILSQHESGDSAGTATENSRV